MLSGTQRLDAAGRAAIGIRSALGGLATTTFSPLWYEERLAGLLLIDPSPRAYLDEDEAILVGAEPSRSRTPIESCRLLSEKSASRKRWLAANIWPRWARWRRRLRMK